MSWGRETRNKQRGALAETQLWGGRLGEAALFWAALGQGDLTLATIPLPFPSRPQCRKHRF